MLVKIKRLHKLAQIPKYQTEGSSGFDIHALHSFQIKPGQLVVVSTGLAFEIPPDYELQVRSRGGTTKNEHLIVANQPGTLDSDYRGELLVLLYKLYSSDRENFGTTRVEAGQRIAQAVLCPVIKATFQEVKALSSTARGEGRMGSTGDR